MPQVTIKKGGQTVTVEETSPGLFGKMGYEYVNQPKLSGTGNPSPNPAPALPGSSSSSSPLLSFANSLDAAVNLARKTRNENSLSIMKPFSGTVAASDFNSILNGLNTASDTSSSDLIKQVSEVTAPDIVTATDDNGNVSGIDKNTGTVIWTARGVGNKQSGPAPKDTSKEDEENDIAAAIGNFQESMTGTNAYRGVSPKAYKYYKDELTRLYGASAALKLDKAMQDAQNPQTPMLPGLRLDYEN